MKDQYKTKKQLIEELEALRKEVAKLRQAEKKRKKPEEALYKTVTQWQTTFDTITDSICLLDEKLIIQRLNKAMSNLLKKDPNEIIGRHCWEIVHGTSEPIPECPILRMKKTLRRESMELLLGERCFDISVDPILDPILDDSDSLIGAVHIITDITERKQAEEGLQKSEEKYRTLYESSKDGIIFTDMGGNILDVNQAYLDMVGYSKEEIIKLTYQQLTPAKWHEMEAEIVKNQITARDYSEEYEKEYIRKDGTVFPITLRVWLIKDEKGEAKGMWGIVREITERKKAEEAITKSQQLLERTFASLRDSVFIIDADTVEVKECNSAASEMFGYSRQEMLGQTTTFLHVDEMALEEFRKYLYAAIEEKGFLDHLEFRMKRKDGEIFPTEHTVTPIEDEQGRRIGWISVVRDITERKKMEEELRESEERYRVLFESSPYPVTLMDLSLNITMPNQLALKLFGYEGVEEIIGKNALDFIVSGDRPRALEDMRKMFETGQIGNIEYPMIKKDDTLFTAELTGSLVMDSKGKPKAVIGISRDITERKRAEEEIMKFKTIADRAGYGVSMSDLEGNLLYINESFAKMHGYTAEELIGRNLSGFHNEEQMENVDRLKKQLREQGSYVAEEVWHKRKDGTTFPTLMNGTLIRDEKGKPQFMAATAIDITERKQAEKALYESEKRYRTLAEAAHDMIFIVNREGFVEYVNTEAADRLGRPPEQVVGQSHAALFPTHVVEQHQVNLRTAMETLEPVYVEERTSFSGGESWTGTWLVPLKDEAGAARAVLGVSRDITDRKRAEKELKDNSEQLRALAARLQSAREEERTQIAREIHDELGQTLTGLKMDLSWLLKKLPQDKKLIEKVKSMFELVDTTIQSVRKVSTELRPGVLDDFGLIAAIEWQAQEFQNRIGIKCDFNSSMEEIDLDRDRSTAVFRIFQEALTNVSRHAKASRVKINLGEDADTLILKIEDNGKGIKESEVSDPKSLGLLGMRERAYIFGGEFIIKGTPGEGTTVILRIPFKK